MTRNSYARWAAMFCSVLVVGLALNATPAFALEDDDLVNTFCGAGMVNECGRQGINETCEWEFSISKEPGSMFGITISIRKCTFGGYMTIYKDYRRGASAGACIQYPRTPADATATGGRAGHDGEFTYEPEYAEGC
jgi:hypothetical protein